MRVRFPKHARVADKAERQMRSTRVLGHMLLNVPWEHSLKVASNLTNSYNGEQKVSKSTLESWTLCADHGAEGLQFKCWQ